MNYVTILGFMAGAITSTAFLPQVIKAASSKKVDDISLLQPVFLSFGILLWLIYGLFLRDLPIILANIIGFFSNTALIWLKIKYSKR